MDERLAFQGISQDFRIVGADTVDVLHVVAQRSIYQMVHLEQDRQSGCHHRHRDHVLEDYEYPAEHHLGMVAERTFHDIYRLVPGERDGRHYSRDHSCQDNEQKADRDCGEVYVLEDVYLPFEEYGHLVLKQQGQRPADDERDEHHQCGFPDQLQGYSQTITPEKPSSGHFLCPEACVGDRKVYVVGDGEHQYCQNNGQQYS